MALLNCLKFINTNNKLREITTNEKQARQGDLITDLRLGQRWRLQWCPATCWLCLHITGYWCPSQQCRNLLWPLSQFITPQRKEGAVREFQASWFPHHSFPWPHVSSVNTKNLWPSTLRAAQVPSFFWIISEFPVNKEIQEDVSSVHCMWQCLPLSQESEAWWIHCQFWGMVFSPYFHYEPGCHLLINFLHWYQFIFTSRGSDVFGKGTDSRTGPARQTWLHLVLENYFSSKDRTWPAALENLGKKKKKLSERKRDTWGKFLLLSQNKSTLLEYHDIILFLRQPCKARWEMPYVVIY